MPGENATEPIAMCQAGQDREIMLPRHESKR
jgi:hypothetical protein